MKWGDVTEKTMLDGKVYSIMEERLSKGQAGTHSDRDLPAGFIGSAVQSLSSTKIVTKKFGTKTKDLALIASVSC